MAEVPEPVTAAYERAAQAWPDLQLTVSEFAAHLAPEAHRDDSRAVDVYLARCCCLGRPGAVREFERTYGPLLQASVPSRLRSSAHLPDDFDAMMLERLLVGPGAPLVCKYNGAGALGAWLRVTVARAAISEVRKTAGRQRREDTVGDLLTLLATQRDPELDYLRGKYRDEFRVAFEHAVETLTDRQRSLVKLSLVRGVSVRRLGTMYGVGHSTAARWVSKAMGQLSQAVRKRFAEQLDAGSDDIESIMRLLDGSLELSISRILGPE